MLSLEKCRQHGLVLCACDDRLSWYVSFWVRLVWERFLAT
jgi:hypothetical protein